MKKLTDRQKEVYIFIYDYINMNGYSPSLSDISKGLYISKPVVKKHIDALTEKEYIKHTPYIARSIVIINHIKAS